MRIHQGASSFVLFRTDCVIRSDVWSQDAEERLILHKLVHSLTSPRPGESISFIVETQAKGIHFFFFFSFLKSIFNQVTPSEI